MSVEDETWVAYPQGQADELDEFSLRLEGEQPHENFATFWMMRPESDDGYNEQQRQRSILAGAAPELFRHLDKVTESAPTDANIQEAIEFLWKLKAQL